PQFVTPATLISSHYLPTNWLTETPIVNSASYQASFILQFRTKNAYVCWNFGSVQCSSAQTIQPNQVAFWRVQVSVNVLNDPTGVKTLSYLGPTGASCASGVSDHCDGSAAPHYLIWQQLPTKSGSKINSDLWESQVQEAAFNQQYTHDVMYELLTSNYASLGSEA